MRDKLSLTEIWEWVCFTSEVGFLWLFRFFRNEAIPVLLYPLRGHLIQPQATKFLLRADLRGFSAPLTVAFEATQS
ncbi:MAG: hypothetical protein H0X66_01540 [Verrucomicrobia bacterium]|nr:hypothetical protein [Verrucomicrobiota bacterium]